ncbi:MAG: anti-phage BREX system Lon protease BrxL [Synechococcaceae cyanobacterium]
MVEFLLGRYCARTDPAEIEEALQIVEKLFKARARDQGSVKIIDIVRARLDTNSDSYMAEVPSLAIRDAQIDDDLVRNHERMLTDDFYTEVSLWAEHAQVQHPGGALFKPLHNSRFRLAAPQLRDHVRVDQIAAAHQRSDNVTDPDRGGDRNTAPGSDPRLPPAASGG